MTATRVRILVGLVAAVALLAALAVALLRGDDADESGLETRDGTSSTTQPRTTTSAEESTTTEEDAPTSAPSTDTAPDTTASVAPAASPPTAPATSAAPPRPVDPLAGARVRLTRVASVDHPIAMAVRPNDGSTWLARKGGGVCRLVGSTCNAVSVAAVSAGGEQGLLGIAFDPTGARLFISYTDPSGTSRVDALAVAGNGTIDLGSRDPILSVAQPQANHNGGNIAFGPDGRLYLGLGDGGGAGDPHGPVGNAQNPATDLGKILRIDPASKAVQRWISGVRNPWRFSFDRATGDLWVADVGQDRWEEVTFLRAGAQQGRNLGWRCFEGTHRFSDCTPAGGHTPPLFEYAHGPGCSITGGYVYRGQRVPALVGAYVFADYCDGELRALSRDGNRVRTQRRLGVDPGNVVSFGQDAAGELYVLTPSAVFRVDPG